MPRMAMDLEFLERGALNRNGPEIFRTRCLEWQWAWNFSSAVPRLEFLERGA